jgi:hypothetical protein
MTFNQLKKAAKGNSFENVTSLIENSGLEVKLIQNLPFTKTWEVKNHKEVSHIMNTIKYLGSNESQFGYTTNY